MFIDFLLEICAAQAHRPAVIWRDQAYSYRWLGERIGHWSDHLAQQAVTPGSAVMLVGDYSPNAIALLLALAERGCILVPLTRAAGAKKEELCAIAQGEVLIEVDAEDEVTFAALATRAHHPLLTELRARQHPGLIVFSSGSSGQPKAALHDLVRVLEKFKRQRRPYRAIAFLLFDHLGGINTALHLLAGGGCIVTVAERTPDRVLEAVARHRVELLPTTPTFLNLMLLSGAHCRHDLSSLRRVTYGTEPMAASTLRRLHQLLPTVELQQTYGLSETGVLGSQSRSADSLFVKLGGTGFETRVVGGALQIRSACAMLGYLNAPSPFTADGWFITGDAVEVDGDYLRILGRQSEVIIVGGEKVFPAEIESVVQELDNVAEVVVSGEKNAITGQIVTAAVVLQRPEDTASFTRRLKAHCRQRLQRYKVPVRVTISATPLASPRFKKRRPALVAEGAGS